MGANSADLLSLTTRLFKRDNEKLGGKTVRHLLLVSPNTWELFTDTEDPEHIVECFMVESWLEHLRQHERVTVADREQFKQRAAPFFGYLLERLIELMHVVLPAVVPVRF